MLGMFTISCLVTSRRTVATALHPYMSMTLWYRMHLPAPWQLDIGNPYNSGCRLVSIWSTGSQMQGYWEWCLSAQYLLPAQKWSQEDWCLFHFRILPHCRIFIGRPIVNCLWGSDNNFRFCHWSYPEVEMFFLFYPATDNWYQGLPGNLWTEKTELVTQSRVSSTTKLIIGYSINELITRLDSTPTAW